jgi:hypothetical protein
MKELIDGILYDTEEAEMVAQFSWLAEDLEEEYEALYRTRDGAWFVYRGDSDGIQPLMAEQARRWCEIHGMDVDSIGEHLPPKNLDR